jgi:hypothetical protein
VLFAIAVCGMQRRSLQRARWAVRSYHACAACLGFGALIGVLLARGTPWPEGSLLGAHLALNLGGGLGMAIVGTLRTFFPSLTQTRLRFPALQGPTFTLWLLGVGLLVLGATFAAPSLIATGWSGLASAGFLLATNLACSLRSAQKPLAVPALLEPHYEPLTRDHRARAPRANGSSRLPAADRACACRRAGHRSHHGRGLAEAVLRR